MASWIWTAIPTCASPGTSWIQHEQWSVTSGQGAEKPLTTFLTFLCRDDPAITPASHLLAFVGDREGKRHDLGNPHKLRGGRPAAWPRRLLGDGQHQPGLIAGGH